MINFSLSEIPGTPLMASGLTIDEKVSYSVSVD